MYIFLIIFFGIILFLIVIAVVGSRKDKKEKQVEMFQRKEDDELSKESYEYVYIKLYETILKLNDELKNFKPSVGIKSMSQINQEAQDVIDEILNSDELKKLYLVEERKEEIKPLIDELKSVQPKRWEQDAFFAWNVIMAKGKNIVDSKSENKSNEELVEKNEEISLEENMREETSYSKLTVTEIKDLLNEKNIEFKSSLKKQELIELLENGK